MQKLNNLVTLLNRLEKNKIFYQLQKIRDSIMIVVSIPGQIWEIEFMVDGSIEIEKFYSKGEIFDEKELDYLFQNFSD